MTLAVSECHLGALCRDGEGERASVLGHIPVPSELSAWVTPVPCLVGKFECQLGGAPGGPRGDDCP